MNSDMEPKDPELPPSPGLDLTGLVSLPGQDSADALVCGPEGCLPAADEPRPGEG